MPTDGPSVPDSTPFPYLQWAKAHLAWEPAGAPSLCLGMSGIAPLTTADRAALGLPPLPEVGPAEDGLKRVIAERYDVTPAHVHLAAGASHANFVTYLALAREGHVEE